MGTTTRSRGTSIPRTVNSYGDEPNDSGDVSAPAFRRTREPRGARRHEEKRLPGRVVDVPGAVRRRVRQSRRGGGRRECAQRAHGHLVRGGRQDRLRAGLVPPRRFGPAHARGMAEYPRSDPGPMDREETARPEGRRGLIPTGDFQLGEPYLPSSDAADRARMNDEVERDVRFDGATARLRGRLHPPIGRAWGSLVMSHGRSEDMGSLLLSALAQSASDQGLWGLVSTSLSRTQARSPRAVMRTKSPICGRQWATRGRRPVLTPSSSRDVASAHGPRWPPRPTSSAPERSSWASATGTTGTADGPGAPRGVRGPHLGPGGIRVGPDRPASVARPGRVDDEREP